MLALTLLLVATPATSASPYEVDWLTDSLLLLSLQVVMGAADAAQHGIAPAGRCHLTEDGSHCDPERLNDLDRHVVGNDSANWALTSDIGLDASFFIAAGGSGLLALTADSSEPITDWLRDGMVMIIATSASSVATSALKYAYSRPRPLQYDSEHYSPTALDHERSFPSGHTSGTAAAMTALTMTVAYRKPWSIWAWASAAATLGLTTLVGIARVEAGRHFYTDVMAGAAIGVAAGVLVPRAYHSDIAVVPSANGLSVAMRF